MDGDSALHASSSSGESNSSPAQPDHVGTTQAALSVGDSDTVPAHLFQPGDLPVSCARESRTSGRGHHPEDHERLSS